MTLRTAGPWSLLVMLILGCGGDQSSTAPEDELLGCTAYGTPVLTPAGSKAIEHFLVGDSVLAVSAYVVKGTGVQLQWSPAAVQFSAGVPPQPPGLSHYPVMVYIGYGSGRQILVTRDAVFLLTSGTLSTASELVPGKSSLVATDGTPVPIEAIALGPYAGGIHNIATSLVLDRRVEGHLLGMNGIVVGDYALQLQWPLMKPAPVGP